jgi:hypothetical protein
MISAGAVSDLPALTAFGPILHVSTFAVGVFLVETGLVSG